MNREIKFKALRQDGGGWVYGYLFLTRFDNVRKNGLSPVIQVINDTNDGYNGYVVIENTICQYTGILDNNGKDVYEGDIVGTVMDYADGNTCEIVFYEGCFCAKHKDNYRPLNETSFVAWVSIRDYDFVIKGNIHE